MKQLLLLGREHYSKQEYDKAKPLLRQVAEQADRFADVHNMLGVIAHTAGQFSDAQAAFERAIELNPGYTEAQLNLVVTYNDLGKYEKSRAVQRAIQSAESGHDVDPFARGKIANMHAEISQAYQDAGMIAEAIQELQKAVHLRPQFVDLRTRLGVLYRDSGDTSQAQEQFEAALEQNPVYVQARVLLGVLLIARGDKVLARSHFEQVLAADPENRSAQMYLRLTGE